MAWGKSVVEVLSKDLKLIFPEMTGFSPQNLWLSRQFYLEYRHSPILQQLVGEIPWGQNILIIQKVKAENDNPSIGIILCAEKDKLEVEVSLRTKTNPIGVSTYELYPQLPEAYKGKLPTALELQKILDFNNSEL